MTRFMTYGSVLLLSCFLAIPVSAQSVAQYPELAPVPAPPGSVLTPETTAPQSYAITGEPDLDLEVSGCLNSHIRHRIRAVHRLAEGAPGAVP